MKVQCWVYFPPKEENLIHQDYEHDWMVGMHGCLEWKWKWKALSHCPTLCSTMDHSPPGSSVHGVLQARILELGSHSSLQGIFPVQGWNLGLPHCGQILSSEPPGKPKNTGAGSHSLLQGIFLTHGSAALLVDSLPAEFPWVVITWQSALEWLTDMDINRILLIPFFKAMLIFGRLHICFLTWKHSNHLNI